MRLNIFPVYKQIRRVSTLKVSDFTKIIFRTLEQNNQTKSCYESLTGYSRFGLFNILKLINLEAGSEVLIPGFVCDVSLIPLKNLNLIPVFYRITDQFQIDYNSLKISANTKILITVNYLGMSQDYKKIKTFCNVNKLLWVNDNSHGFASKHKKKFLHLFGDFSITSFWKVLPVTNGALICINNDKFIRLGHDLDLLNNSSKFERKTSKFLIKSFFGFFNISFVRRQDYLFSPNFYDRALMEFRIDKMSKKIFNHFLDEDIQIKRYDLYNKIDSFFSEKKFSFLCHPRKLLKNGNSPLAYPISVKSDEYRKAIIMAGRKFGVDIYTWPSLPKAVIEHNICDSLDLWKRLIYLPINQNINAEEYCSRLDLIFSNLVSFND
jgi:dTDP-4-amino-4,6-dideoxygalactose transaminase